MTAIILLCVLGTFWQTSVAGEFELEAGSRVSADTYVSLDQTYVSFSRPFIEPPVVIALMDSIGGNSAMLRITNVSIAGFFAVITEPEGWDGEHIPVNFAYIAMTPGTHRLPSGDIIAAGRVSTNSVQHGSNITGTESFTSVTFGDTLDTTATVLAGLQTAVNESNAIPDEPAAPFMTATVQNPTPSSVQLAIERSESSLGTVTSSEVIGWIAFPSGVSGSFVDLDSNIIDWSALTTSANVQGWDNGCFTNNHGLNSANAVVIAKKNTHNDDDGGWFRSCSQSSTTIGLRVDEDRGKDIERNHPGESAGIIAFSDGFHAVFDEQQISGTVFEDNGVGGAIAFDGSQGGTEQGLVSRVIAIIDDGSGVLLASTVSASDGTYVLDIPGSAIGQVVRLTTSTGINHRGVSEAPGALPGLVNISDFDDQVIFTPAKYDVYTDASFGQLDGPSLSTDRMVTISPGGTTRLSHIYTSTSDATVSFATSVSAETPAGSYVLSLYRDTDCSGGLNAGEPVLSGPVAASVGNDICIIVVTAVASGVAAGGSIIYDVTAQTDLPGITLVLNDQNTDQITIDENGLLILVKQVCNITTSICDPLDGTGFAIGNTGAPGDILQYRITFTVNGPDSIEDIDLLDITPGLLRSGAGLCNY